MLHMLMLATIGTMLSAARGEASTQVGHRPPQPRPFCVSCRIVDLSAVVGGGAVELVPTAINNADQIVGYDGGAGKNGRFGGAYFIDSNLSFVPFGQNLAYQNYTFNIPTAINNAGKSIVEDAIYTDQFGSQNEGIAVWTVVPGSVTFVGSGPGDSDQEVRISNTNVPIAGDVFYDFKSLSPTQFPSRGCTITDFLARAVNDAGIIVGSGGGYAAYGSTTSCAKPIAASRPANGFTEAHGINSAGDLLVSLTGPAAPAFGAELLVRGAQAFPIALPSPFSSRSFYLVARAISDGDEVVGDIHSQTPPFATVAPFIYRNGMSTDLNSSLPRNSGWTLLTAVGVSVGGEIIGTGYHNGVFSGYALQP